MSKPDVSQAKSSADFQQQQGAAWDILAEAIDHYNEWMLDDDYNDIAILHKIINRMKERRDLYRATVLHGDKP